MEIEAGPVTPTDDETISLNVSNLSFYPTANATIEKPLEALRYHLSLVNLDFFLPFYYGPSRKLRDLDGSPLKSVSLTARGGELVGVFGAFQERHELIQLLTGRKKTGTFDGSISLRGGSVADTSFYYNSVTLVQKVIVLYASFVFIFIFLITTATSS